jgi:hypothetical protein
MVRATMRRIVLAIVIAGCGDATPQEACGHFVDCAIEFNLIDESERATANAECVAEVMTAMPSQDCLDCVADNSCITLSECEAICEAFF